MTRFRSASLLVTVVAAALAGGAAGCGNEIDYTGGGGGDPADSTPMATATPDAPVTIRLTSSGADPRRVIVAVGGELSFTNGDAVVHEPASTNCPTLNVGPLLPQSTVTTKAPDDPTRCRFHDASQPGNPAFHGIIDVARPDDS